MTINGHHFQRGKLSDYRSVLRSIQGEGLRFPGSRVTGMFIDRVRPSGHTLRLTVRAFHQLSKPSSQTDVQTGLYLLRADRSGDQGRFPAGR